MKILWELKTFYYQTKSFTCSIIAARIKIIDIPNFTEVPIHHKKHREKRKYILMKTHFTVM